MTTDLSKRVNSILSDLLRSDKSVNIVLLGDRTGLTINRLSRLMVLATETEFDSIGAIASAVFCGAAEQGNALSLGNLGVMVAEFGRGKILTASCGQGILVVVTDKDSQLGLVRVSMKGAASELSDLLSKLKPSAKVEKPAAPSVMSALKELDSL